MTVAPDIKNSSEEERRNYIKKMYPCIADCDMCGLCTVFHEIYNNLKLIY